MTDAYLTASEARAYCTARQLSLTIDDDATLSALLLRASDWIDAVCIFRGEPAQPHQQRAWPRIAGSGYDSGEADALPPALIQVVVTLTRQLARDEAEAARALGLAHAITQERIGSVQLRYHADGKTTPPLLRPLLPYLRQGQMLQVRRS